MSLKQYEAFLKTVDLGSLTKAAESLGYTQSGISHMLNTLEEETGVKLLLRDRSGVKLTSDGKILLPYMRNIVNDNHGFMEKVKELRGVKSGLIRIGAFTSVCVQWLPGIIKSFRKEYPDIDFEFMYGDYTESKRKQERDGSFTFDKHKIFLYKEDFEKFQEGLAEVIGYIQDNFLGGAPAPQQEDGAAGIQNDEF